MKTALAMLAGGAIGALAIQGLHAQQTGAPQQLPKVIYVAEIDISDPVAYGKDYAPKVLPMIKQFGGTFLAVGGTGGGFPNMTQLTGFDGQPPKVAVLQGEPLRVCRRLQLLRRWSHEQADKQQVLA